MFGLYVVYQQRTNELGGLYWAAIYQGNFEKCEKLVEGYLTGI